MSRRLDRIIAVLNQTFQPTSLEVLDDSARHAGHAGHRPEGETHYQVKMTAAAFTGLSRVACQRLVNKALQAEFDDGLHALELSLSAPR